MGILLGFLTLAPFSGAHAQGVNVIRNGDFTGGISQWVVNPRIDPLWNPVSEGVVSLSPDDSYLGNVIHQNLNVTNIADTTFHFSMDLGQMYNWSDSQTIAVNVSWVDNSGNLHRDTVIEPPAQTLPSDPSALTPVTADFTFPTEARKLVKLEISRECYNYFTADNIVFSADGVTVGPVPTLSGVTPTTGPYGTQLTLVGTDFGSTPGFVSVGGSSEGVEITSWESTVITATVGDPVRSGRIYVVNDYVESDPAFSFNVTSPNYTVDVMEDRVKVIRGQMAEFVISVEFWNGFTTQTGIALSLMSPAGGGLPIHDFTPVPLKNRGGAVLKIDTSSLAAGEHQFMVQAIESHTLPRTAGFGLEVVTVSDIQFWQWDATYTNRTLINTEGSPDLTVTKQGWMSLYWDVIDSNGEILDSSAATALISGNPAILAAYPNPWGSHDIYAMENGLTTLTAQTPDGFAKSLDVQIAIPDSPKVTSAALDFPTISNTDTYTVTFSATGTESLGYGTSGSISFLTHVADWSPDNTTVTRQFTVDHENTPLGTCIFSAFTGGLGGYTSERPAFLNIVNAPSFSAALGGVKSVDRNLSPYMMEHFVLEFYDTEGTLAFSREVSSYHHQGAFSLGAIPPGSYRIKCVPGEGTGIEAQWYPNAPDLASADPVPFTQTLQAADIYFFLRYAPVPEQTYSVSGTVAPSGGPGLEGVSFDLSTASGAPLNMLSDSNGEYTFTNVAPGDYTLTPSLTGYSFDPMSRGVTILDSDVTGMHFTAIADSPVLTSTLSGSVTTSAPGYEVGVLGALVTVTGEGATYTTTTSQDGTWRIVGIPQGTYTITMGAEYHGDVVLPDVSVSSREVDVGSRIMEVTAPSGAACDINGDGIVDLTEVIYWLQIMSGARLQ